MSKKILPILATLLLAALAACQSTGGTNALETRLAALESRVTEGASAADVNALTERVNALESESADPLFAVAMATYILDTAGLHGMDVAINESSEIESSYAGTVNRVARLLSATPWPPELAEEAVTMQATLAEFAEALSNDDVEAAKPLATRTHEEQHDFSHNIGAWINGQLGIEGGEGDH